ncbi:hypothetical protein PHYSODRAFT_303257 [Phytophthora sojae]|uniref:Uncharacterized protein n=1 Tax=Phytophthora sojae (strain P6497) TaxID=1094619 RepID=G4ZRR9_PHYSP|nr:hypothetical protein PHYSODRAFT_303257 [Phytophthora sojae]EGZ13878.1 hypothetical protein PHYSODRAFT_303257 [Phytophthora sojae]|eukprot:XP_009531307.1 hypothetical protein PHYSODRAFT_303257 [Phytophthora sojae]
MDCLQRQLARCSDSVKIRHHQHGEGTEISSTLFVDDQLDVTTTERGISARADVTNKFTGKFGSGGVFGAAKSFMMYLADNNSHLEAVQLNDGLGVPHPVQVVAPAEGFKHLAHSRSATNPTHEFVISAIPLHCQQGVRLWYRMILGGAISTAALVDTFIRQVARTVLRLPFSTPRQVFYDQQNGVGLESCELDANVHRMQEALRILNSPELPVYHLLVERLEAYQTHAGLPDNPLVLPVKPPAQVRTWEAQLIRFAASLKPPLRFAVKWTHPPAVRSLRANDRPLIEITPPQLRSVLVAVNWNSDCKLIFVGDLCGYMEQVY